MLSLLPAESDGRALRGMGKSRRVCAGSHHCCILALRCAPLFILWGAGPATGAKGAFSECITETLKAAQSDRNDSNHAMHLYQMKVPRYIIRWQWWQGAPQRLTQMSHLEIYYCWDSVCCHIFTERLCLFEWNGGSTAVGIFKVFICWCSCTWNKEAVTTVTFFFLGLRSVSG